MKIALTGSSSVGKTTLLASLLQHASFRAVAPAMVSTDARSLLRRLGHASMDAMTQDETRSFQSEYFARKQEQEASHTAFVTDRSFVDVAAYWIERDTVGCRRAIRDSLVGRCRDLSKAYTMHVYLPFGVIPFEGDGYRSDDMDFHWRVDGRIRALLAEWNLTTLVLDTPDHQRRVELVLGALGCHGE